jgi:hypothetical protein
MSNIAYPFIFTQNIQSLYYFAHRIDILPSVFHAASINHSQYVPQKVVSKAM